jgi:uridine kinase
MFDLCKFDLHNESMNNIIIGIAGGTASGKSTLARTIHEQSGPSDTVIIKMDDYYGHRPHLSSSEREAVNYDHPDAFDVPLLLSHLELLKKGTSILQPTYDFKTHLRSKKTIQVNPAPVIILEGIMTFAIPLIRAMIDYKIFVDTPTDIRLLRRIKRDIEERGRDLASIEYQYMNTVRPMHDLFVEPSKVHADIIVPEGGYNPKGADILLSKIASIVKESVLISPKL